MAVPGLPKGPLIQGAKLRLLLLMAGLMLGGCKPLAPDDNENILRINLSNGVNSLDVAQATNQGNIWIVGQLYEGLLALDSALKPVGAISDSFGSSPDGLLWTFRIRDDVLFHDDKCFNGKPRTVTAYDFEFSLRRILDPATGSSGAAILRSALGDSASGSQIAATGPRYLNITLTRPYVPILSVLAAPIMGVIAPEAVEYYGKDIRIHPVGTGPFKLGYWIENEKLVLHANRHYRIRALPKLKAIEVNTLTNKLTEFFALLQGKIDLLSGLDAARDLVLDSSNLLKVELKGQIVLERWPFLNSEYIGITVGGDAVIAALKDSAVRQALSLALNRTEMLTFLRRGIGQPAWNGIVPPSLDKECASPELEYNIDSAISLMRKAGYTQLQPLKVTLYTTAQYTDLMLYAAKAWQIIGVDAKVETLAPGPLRELRKAGKATLFRASWIADYADAESYFSLFYSGNIPPNGPNYTRYNNPEFDRAYRKSAAGSQQGFCRMVQMLNTTLPAIPLYHDEAITLSSTAVSGFRLNALNVPDFRYVTVSKR